MIPLNYNQLYYFFKIAELGSIASASKDVLISSPALSMQLKELEENLGTPLFSRVGKKLVLTEAGTIVHEYARDIFKLGFELKDVLADRGQGQERAKIEIGCQDSIPKKVADELLSFLISSKACKVILQEGNQEKLLQMQREYKLDLVLTHSVPHVGNAQVYESRRLCSQDLMVVAHPKFKGLRSKWPLSLKETPFILPTYDSSSRQKIDQYFDQQKVFVDVVAEVEDHATALDLAVKGHGLTAVMENSVRHLIERNLLVEIGTMRGVQEEIWMVLGKRKILNPLALFAMKNFTLSLK